LLSNSAGGTILNESGAILNNEQQITNFGIINNQVGGRLNNHFIFNGVTGSTLTNGGTFTNTNTFITNGTTDNTGLFRNLPTATLQNFGVFNNSGGLANSGGMQIASGGVLNNTGGFGNTEGGVTIVQSGGTLNNSGTIANFQGGGLSVLSGGTFNNSGSLTNDFLSGFGTAAGSTVINTGTMSLAGNIVVIGGSLKKNGVITLMAGPIPGDPPIPMPPPPLLVTSTGTLSGTGSVTGDVIMQGRMAPGDSLGALIIHGNYTQSASGTLAILLGGIGQGDFSQLDISGLADLSGSLVIELAGGFDPQASQSFEILESGGISNLNFLSTLFPALTNGLSFKLDVEGNDIFLDVVGGSGSGGTGGGGNSVPEPGTGALLISALVFGALRLRKRAQIART